jgi:hypothetical protein
LRLGWEGCLESGYDEFSKYSSRVGSCRMGRGEESGYLQEWLSETKSGSYKLFPLPHPPGCKIISFS